MLMVGGEGARGENACCSAPIGAFIVEELVVRGVCVLQLKSG
jgi:hypothetical protein